MAGAFCRACFDGELEAVRRLLAEGVSPGSVDSNGLPALWCAALNGHAAVVELLLGAGAGVDVRNPGGYTALMIAAMCGQLDVVRLLLRAGADPALKNKRGKVVSKSKSAAGKKSFANIKGWFTAVQQAKKALGGSGFVAIGGKTAQGKALYSKAKARSRRQGGHRANT